MIAERVSQFGTTIFAEMTALAEAHQAINLGQGFPDFAAPDFIKEAAQAAIGADINQYAPSMGRPRLRRAVAAKMKEQYGRDVNPDMGILITHGATEAIFAAIMGLVNPGDEVIVLEPTYDSYVPCIRLAGGVPRFLTLRPPDWRIDPAALAALFNEKTCMIILNTPHNPIGKVYTETELTEIATLCQYHNVVALVDEVYEHLVYDEHVHLPLANLPGMPAQTVTISSLGKTFSTTGWKVGWAIAPPELLRGIFRVHQFVTFCGATPLQEAAAAALETAVSRHYYADLVRMYQAKRDFLVEALAQAGLNPITPQGTYFVMCDISGLGFADDVTFCRHLTTEIGVAAIPPSAFYNDPADGANLARFAFCKSEAALQEAAERLLLLQK